MRNSLFFSFIVLSTCLSTNALAIVNMKSLHLNEPEQGISGSVEFGLNGAQGNSERFRVNGGALLQWYKPGTLRYITLDGAYGESFSRRDQNNSFAHIRQIKEINQIIDWEIFSQWESDEFARLNSRTLAGGGLRFAIAEKTKTQAIYLGSGLFYSRENINSGGNTTDDGLVQDIKANLYLIFKKQLFNNLMLQSTTYAQPALDDINDFKLLEDASLNLKLTETLGLALNLQVNYDNRPPQTVQKDNYVYNTSIKYEF